MSSNVLTKHDPLEEGIANYPSITCHENLMNYIKGQKGMTPKDESPRSEGVPYATGEEQRRTTNRSRENEVSGPKWK